MYFLSGIVGWVKTQRERTLTTSPPRTPPHSELVRDMLFRVCVYACVSGIAANAAENNTKRKNAERCYSIRHYVKTVLLFSTAKLLLSFCVFSCYIIYFIYGDIFDTTW